MKIAAIQMVSGVDRDANLARAGALLAEAAAAGAELAALPEYFCLMGHKDSDKLALRVDGAYRKRDGYIKDANADREFNNIDRFLVRGQALYDTSTFSLRLIGDYYETDEQCCGAVSSSAGVTGPIVDGLAALAGVDGIVQPFDLSARRMAVCASLSVT